MAYDLYAMVAQEDRCGPRNWVRARAMLRPAGARGFATIVRDISIAGFSAEAANRMHPGALVWLTMPGLESMQAQVVWWQDGIVGCAFANLLSHIVLEDGLKRWRMAAVY